MTKIMHLKKRFVSSFFQLKQKESKNNLFAIRNLKLLDREHSKYLQKYYRMERPRFIFTPLVYIIK